MDLVTEAWAALRMIREAVEEFGPRAALESQEAVNALRAPTLVDEAQAIVDALVRVRHAPIDYGRTVIQRLHDVEVNARVSSMFEGHWTVRIGDDLNGWTAADTVGSFAEAEEWLYRTAKATIFTPAVVRDLAER